MNQIEHDNEHALYKLFVKMQNMQEHTHETITEMYNICIGKLFRIEYTDTNGNTKSFFINNHSMMYIRDSIINGNLSDDLDKMHSDYMKEYCCNPIRELKLYEYIPKNKSKEGMYFTYKNNSTHDLSKYQIYNEQQLKTKSVDMHCLLHSLSLCGVNTSIISSFIMDEYFDCKNLKLIAEKLSVNIIVHGINSDDKATLKKYPKNIPFQTSCHLALYENHYFVYEKIRINNKNVYSIRLVHNLFQNGELEPLDISPIKIITNDECDLKYSINEQILFDTKEKQKNKLTSVSYADTECIIRPHHIPFLYARYYVNYETGEVNYKVFNETGNYQGFKSFLNSFSEKTNIVYFHNLKYDWLVLKKCPYINLRSILEKDNTYYRVKFTYYNKIFEFRDSYKLIPKKLSDFPEAFGLNGIEKHQYILYELYTLENTKDLANDFVSYKDYENEDYQYAYTVSENGCSRILEKLPGDEYIIIDGRLVVSKNILKFCGNYFVNGRYYHLAHCRYYIKMDCLILKHGVEKFRELMKNTINVDCFDELTLSSMVYKRACLNGYFDGIYELKDNIRMYVTKSVQGGRVSSKYNGMWDVTGKIQLLDINSLYPSSICRICEEGGFPVGPSQIITDWTDIDKYYYYVITIKILKVGKRQQMPFLCYLTEDKCRHYTNDMENKVVTIDKITFEDWVKYHKIEYEYIEGIYWDNGGNPSMGNFVKTLYDSRLQYTKDGNSVMCQITKLILVSLYGKTIIKPNHTKTVVKNNDKVDNYIVNNFQKLVSQEKYANQSVVTVISNTLGHKNMAHIGGMILSMARRIMNEILDLANTLGIHALYQDTDSVLIVDTLLIDTNFESIKEKSVVLDHENDKNTDKHIPGNNNEVDRDDKNFTKGDVKNSNIDNCNNLIKEDPKNTDIDNCKNLIKEDEKNSNIDNCNNLIKEDPKNTDIDNCKNLIKEDEKNPDIDNCDNLIKEDAKKSYIGNCDNLIKEDAKKSYIGNCNNLIKEDEKNADIDNCDNLIKEDEKNADIDNCFKPSQNVNSSIICNSKLQDFPYAEYKNKLDELCKEYKNKFNKELIGKQLGQFKNDLKYNEHTDVHSSRCIILGKKSYLNVVTGKNNNTGLYETYNFPKMSGVNCHAMSEYSDYLDVYQRLYNGETIKFDLAYGDSVVFDFKDTVTTRDSYIKHMSYDNVKYKLQ